MQDLYLQKGRFCVGNAVLHSEQIIWNRTLFRGVGLSGWGCYVLGDGCGGGC